MERMTPLSELIGGDEIREAKQTCAKVLSNKEDNGGDVEIAKPFRDCGEGDGCGALRLYMHEGKASSIPRSERQKIRTMTASLVDVSVVLDCICCSVGRPSRASVGKDGAGEEWIGYIRWWMGAKQGRVGCVQVIIGASTAPVPTEANEVTRFTHQHDCPGTLDFRIRSTNYILHLSSRM